VYQPNKQLRIIDLIAHALENFFGEGESNLSDLFISSIIRDAMYYGPLVMKEPANYDYRANIMWDATCALNGVTAWGKASGDWGVHSYRTSAVNVVRSASWCYSFYCISGMA